MQVNSYTNPNGDQWFFFQVPSNEPLLVKLIELVGYISKHQRYTRHLSSHPLAEFTCNSKQAHIITELVYKGFEGAGFRSDRLERSGKVYSLVEALEAIDRPDLVVENFLDAVDGA